jgi:hypothetical protein
MSFQVVTNLSKGDKARKNREAIEWLKSQGLWIETESLHQTLLEAHSLTQLLINDLHQQEEKSAAASKLASHIEELIQTIKP